MTYSAVVSRSGMLEVEMSLEWDMSLNWKWNGLRGLNEGREGEQGVEELSRDRKG
jgi:hypothetical protein